MRINRLSYVLKSISLSLDKEIRIRIGLIKTPGVTWFTIRLFIYIRVTNYLGLIPYVFTSSRHLRFTLTLAMLV